MHTFSQYDQLLTRYLLNELDAVEEENLLIWIESSEENRAYLEKFAAAWNLSSAPGTIRNFDIDEEWLKHQMNMDHSGTVVQMQDYFPIGQAAGAPQNGGYLLPQPTKYKNWWKIPAIAAACVVLAIGLYFMKTGNKASETRPAEIIARSAMLAAPSGVQTVTNHSTGVTTLALSDGSTIVLYQNSELTYDSLFAGTVRSVLLRGKADFNVAVNKSKPFIVTHGNLATHVLGTRFTVVAPVNAKTQRIRLYEGKVMISAADGIGRLRGSYYLLPGQEFVYKEGHNTGLVRTFGKNSLPVSTAAADGDKEEITLPDHSNGSWFMFNNQPLSEVFTQLQGVYNVRIDFNAADLHKMYFIGKFDKSDSLNVILNRMAMLYHLKVTRKQDKYIISK